MLRIDEESSFFLALSIVVGHECCVTICFCAAAHYCLTILAASFGVMIAARSMWTIFWITSISDSAARDPSDRAASTSTFPHEHIRGR